MSIVKPPQAVAEYIGEQFIEWLGRYIPQEIKLWPIIGKISTAHSKPEKIRKFIMQIFMAEEAYLGARAGDPGFLRFIIGNLSENDDPVAENALEILEKIRTDELTGHKEEKGIMQTKRREVWLKLLRVLGATDEELERAEPKEPTRNYIADLSEIFSTSEWPMAVGAFVCMHLALAEQNKIVGQLLKNNLSLSEKDLEALDTPSPVHHLLDKIVFDPETKELVWQGIDRQMIIRQEFLNGLQKYL